MSSISNGLSSTTKELNFVVSRWRYWLYRSFVRVQILHNNTALGVFWEAVTMILVSIALSAVWSVVLQVRDFWEFFLYVLCGFPIWGLISSLVNRGVRIFFDYSNFITNSSEPLLLFIIEDATLSLIRFLIIIPIVIIIIFFFQGLSLSGLLYFTLGLIFIFCTGVGIACTLGIASLFFKDIKEIISAIMRLAFLITPVIWQPERLGDYEKYIWLNPFYSYLEICRSGLLGNPIDSKSWIICICITLTITVAGLTILRVYDSAIRYKTFDV